MKTETFFRISYIFLYSSINFYPNGKENVKIRIFNYLFTYF